MDDHIQEARRQVFIQPSTSPAASSCCFVGKKDGGLRPCIDYITLNSQTVKLPYPLSLVPAALEELRGACIFSKLDLRSAYNLIRIWESDEYKTAFTTPSGHYEYKVISFGLSNSLSIFQTIMNEVFREFLHRFISMYIDDILIYSRNLAEHCHHVTQVLQQLRQHSLYLNLTRNQNPSSLQPSSSVPSSGTSLRTSVSRTHRTSSAGRPRRENLCPYITTSTPSGAQCTIFRALNTQAAHRPSRSFKFGSGGPV